METMDQQKSRKRKTLLDYNSKVGPGRPLKKRKIEKQPLLIEALNRTLLQLTSKLADPSDSDMPFDPFATQTHALTTPTTTNHTLLPAPNADLPQPTPQLEGSKVEMENLVQSLDKNKGVVHQDVIQKLANDVQKGRYQNYIEFKRDFVSMCYKVMRECLPFMEIHKHVERLLFFGLRIILKNFKNEHRKKDEPCTVCGKSSYPSQQLLCDHCDDPYHTFCLRNPLRRVPSGNWYCERCLILQQNSTFSASLQQNRVQVDLAGLTSDLSTLQKQGAILTSHIPSTLNTTVQSKNKIKSSPSNSQGSNHHPISENNNKQPTTSSNKTRTNNQPTAHIKLDKNKKGQLVHSNNTNQTHQNRDSSDSKNKVLRRKQNLVISKSKVARKIRLLASKQKKKRAQREERNPRVHNSDTGTEEIVENIVGRRKLDDVVQYKAKVRNKPSFWAFHYDFTNSQHLINHFETKYANLIKKKREEEMKKREGLM